ncbi:metallophosphoesterase, partial [Candidatus Uhrbacteria bacterium]|nr:metallophosphoesterase [Candidatus Uhrbacteria bacterium]
VLGNHDYLDDAETLRAMLAAFGVRILKNERVFLGKGNEQVAIVGVDDLWFGDVDLELARMGISEEMPQILLTHNPDLVFSLKPPPVAAILAAHTHGGQIRLPFIGAVPEIPTSLGRRYARGRFDWNGVPLLITSGLGVTGPRARLLAPPEVMIIDVYF